MPGDNSRNKYQIAAQVNIKIKHLLTAELLKYMFLRYKGSANSKPVTWNGNSAHTTMR